jgi:hypothetical protein
VIKPRPPEGVTLSGPTCPVCWPWKQLDPELAEWHRTWHTLQGAHRRAQARYNFSGQAADERRVTRTAEALWDFEDTRPPDPA